MPAIERELEELERERAALIEARERYDSPPEREARRAARIGYLGAWLLSAPLSCAAVLGAGYSAEEAGDAWLFFPDVLTDDGVQVED